MVRDLWLTRGVGGVVVGIWKIQGLGAGAGELYSGFRQAGIYGLHIVGLWRGLWGEPNLALGVYEDNVDQRNAGVSEFAL